MKDFSNNHGVEIICIGTELLLGNIINTNSRWLAEELSILGLPHYRQTVIGDNLERLKQAVIEASKRSHILITTGGLGPTPDDLTTETLASTFQVALEERPELWIEIQEKLKDNHEVLSQNNRKQALMPKGARVLPNPSGTAPGMIWSPKPGFTLLTFPGVPEELKQMWFKTAVPWLKANGRIKNKLATKTLKFAGIPESKLSELVSDLLEQKNPTVAPYANTGEVKLRITASGKSIHQAKDLLTPTEEKLKSRTGLLCYGSDSDTLASVVIELLRKEKKTIVVAESCTGGKLGATIAGISGASDVFLGGIIAYNNRIKEEVLKVPAKLLEQHGAVSEEVVKAMANGARQILGSDWAIAISGIAGPKGGTEQKPVGTVYIAITGPQTDLVVQKKFGHHLGRTNIQKISVIESLNRLRLLTLAGS